MDLTPKANLLLLRYRQVKQARANKMPTSKQSASYPAFFNDACLAAYGGTIGELALPSVKPSALRLQFNGYRAALRLEGKSDIVDSLSFHVTATHMIIRCKDSTAEALAAEEAIALFKGVLKPSQDEADDFFARLLAPKG